VARTLAVVGAPDKIAVSLAAFVAHHRNGLGIQQVLGLQMPAFLLDPIPVQLFHQETRGPRSSIELASVEQVGK